MDYSQPESLAYFKEVARYWVEQYGIDGWRPIRLISSGWMTGAPFAARWSRPARRARPPASSGAPSATWWGVWKGADEIRAQAYGPSDNPALSSAFDFPCATAWVQALAVEESGKGGQGASVLDASWNKVENYPTTPCPTRCWATTIWCASAIRWSAGNFNGADYWQRHKAAFSFMAARPVPLPSTWRGVWRRGARALPVRWGRLCGPGALR